jgi:curved DNA-binding protein CbpA
MNTPQVFVQVTAALSSADFGRIVEVCQNFATTGYKPHVVLDCRPSVCLSAQGHVHRLENPEESMARDIGEVKAEIDEMFERLDNSTNYELLGVDKDATSDTITAQFRALAKKWHVDRFSMYDLGEDKAKLQKIFSSINNAHRTLTNEESRRAYDDELNNVGDEESGVDVVALLNAESMFVRAKNMVNQGSYKGAFDILSEANKLDPENIEIEAYTLYTEYMLMPKDDGGKPLKTKLERAQNILKRFDEMLEKKNDADWVLTFAGTVNLGLGKERTAKSMFMEALMSNPQNTEAKRQLRLIDLRKGKGNDEGLLSKIKGLFGMK